MTDICDKEICSKEAMWIVYAAYDLDTRSAAVHPNLARYPAPMIRACSSHVIDLMQDDARKGASTKQWVVKPIST